ncbi:hypothetical protein OSSY52_04130 [Tepiditoga spiralis]|uniref:Uncharacterized protein n=1 Tax=Tepiditoga spiralis TaxID=2108365 RepID=A0A7G1G8B1_9BACT|nr:hypothetical protein OSSY52_04130 [Tepiditoga spiralis]
MVLLFIEKKNDIIMSYSQYVIVSVIKCVNCVNVQKIKKNKNTFDILIFKSKTKE